MSTYRKRPASPHAPLDYIPAEICCAQDYEVLAEHFLEKARYAYIAGGSGHDITLQANREAFSRYTIYPRILADVSKGHTRINLLGQELQHPILLAPVAYQTLAHSRGELDSARAAAATDTTMVCSTLSTYPMEEIAALAAQCWFQLYFQPNREDTLDLVRRAEASGYSALLVTLDATLQLPSLRARRAGFVMPEHCRAANQQKRPTAPQQRLAQGESAIFQGYLRGAPDWDELAWLQQQTTLPVLVKGVMHPEDALRLQAMGIAGIVVSNHGGRTLDGVPASLSCLPAMRAVLGADYPIVFDSGIRSGSDIFKALALGANAVLIGRLQMFALSVAGALGVAHMLRQLREELEVCMATAGCATVEQIQPAMLLDQAGT